jgi:hypothetical protein
MQAPSATELAASQVVLEALEQAWIDSDPLDLAKRHEEGGWIYVDVSTGGLFVRRAPAGGQASVDLSTPPQIQGAVVVGKFHTPTPTPPPMAGSPGPVLRSAGSTPGTAYLI